MELEDKSQRHCHIDQIRKRTLALTTEECDGLADSISMENTLNTPDLSDSLTGIPDSPLNSDDSEESGHFELLPDLTSPPEGPPLPASSPRYPTRVRKPPDRFF